MQMRKVRQELPDKIKDGSFKQIDFVTCAYDLFEHIETGRLFFIKDGVVWEVVG